MTSPAMLPSVSAGGLTHRRARGTLAARKEKARRDANRIERVALTAEGKEDQREDGYLVADVEDIGRPSQPGR